MKASVVYTSLKGHSSGQGHFHMSWWNHRANLKAAILNALVLTQQFLTFSRWDTPARNTLRHPGCGAAPHLETSVKHRHFLPHQYKCSMPKRKPLPKPKEMSCVRAGTEIQEIPTHASGLGAQERPTWGGSDTHHSVTVPESYSVLCF